MPGRYQTSERPAGWCQLHALVGRRSHAEVWATSAPRTLDFAQVRRCTSAISLGQVACSHGVHHQLGAPDVDDGVLDETAPRIGTAPAEG